MPAIDRALLRMGVFELAHRPDVPDRRGDQRGRRAGQALLHRRLRPVRQRHALPASPTRCAGSADDREAEPSRGLCPACPGRRCDSTRTGDRAATVGEAGDAPALAEAWADPEIAAHGPACRPTPVPIGAAAVDRRRARAPPGAASPLDLVVAGAGDGAVLRARSGSGRSRDHRAALGARLELGWWLGARAPRSGPGHRRGAAARGLGARRTRAQQLVRPHPPGSRAVRQPSARRAGLARRGIEDLDAGTATSLGPPVRLLPCSS